MYEKEYKRVCRKIKKLAEREKWDQTVRIVIFGVSENSKQIIAELRNQGLKIIAVIDNDEKKQGTFCSGILVSPPSFLFSEEKEKLRIFVHSYFWQEITKQLKYMGFADSTICLIKRNKLRELAISRFGVVCSGLWVYRKLIKDISQRPVFLCPYTGTGDIYLIGSFWKEYIERNNIQEYLFIVVSTACRKTAKIFKINPVVQITKDQADWLVCANMFLPDVCRLTILNDGWGTIYTSPVQWLRGAKGLNFVDMFRYTVFSLTEDSIPQKPIIGGHEKEIMEYFKKNGLICGKTIILAPYATTLTEFSNDFWERLASDLKKIGFCVCTNSCGAEEPVIRDTIGVFFSLDIAPEFVNYAGGFIGVRSGFCDIISSCKVPKVVLYDKDSFFYEGKAIDYFSLNKLRFCDDAYEILYEDKNNAEVLKYIIAIYQKLHSA